MARMVRCGLIQAASSTPTEEPLEKIKHESIEKHSRLIDEAARKGAKILCMQEIFTGPYFCAEQSTRWYGMVEKIPDGPTVQLMREIAKKHGMAMIVPIYEEDLKGVYYNTAAVIDADGRYLRSEEHTSELQSLAYLVCRLLLEKKKKHISRRIFR